MTKLDDADGVGASAANSNPSGTNDKEMENVHRNADSADQTAEAIGNVSLNPTAHKPGPGPSLLTQQAPTRGSDIQRDTGRVGIPVPEKPPSTSMDATTMPLSESAMSVDGGFSIGSVESHMSVNPEVLNVTERITVKIADLGNGEFFF